jgi:hypothetical protein
MSVFADHRFEANRALDAALKRRRRVVRVNSVQELPVRYRGCPNHLLIPRSESRSEHQAAHGDQHYQLGNIGPPEQLWIDLIAENKLGFWKTA